MHRSGSQEQWSLLEDWSGLAPTKVALDLGAGAGHHSLWLAERGFHVDAVEINPDLAVELIKTTHGLPIDVHGADVLDFDPERSDYGLILGAAVLHFLLPSQLWELSDRIVRWLAPRGLLLAEVVTTADPTFKERERGEMIEPNTFVQGEGEGKIHYFEPCELRRVFSQLEILEYEEYRRLARRSESGYRAGASLVGQKVVER